MTSLAQFLPGHGHSLNQRNKPLQAGFTQPNFHAISIRENIYFKLININNYMKAVCSHALVSRTGHFMSPFSRSSPFNLMGQQFSNCGLSGPPSSEAPGSLLNMQTPGSH